jgi:hypothetical protein
MNNARRLRLMPLALTLWLTITGMGFWRFHAYSTVPGSAGIVPSHDPSRSSCPRLILFAHPHCPCTRSTLAELAGLLERNREAIAVEVEFIRPKGLPEGWEQTSLWQTAAAIPGVSVRCDEGGKLARRLGAQTSGQVLLYASAGQLLFSGGITRARGQEGESVGRRAILDLLTGHTTRLSTRETPVFGCPLFAPDECCGKEDTCRP